MPVYGDQHIVEPLDWSSPAEAEVAEQDEADPDDLWPRLRARLELHGISRPEVLEEVKWFEENSDFLDRSFMRGRPYLHYIVEEVERRGMPGDIALLPVVESAFQPLAYSPGKASGIWQFIPATGKRFGLAQNSLYDGRRDIVASTRAALDYLEELRQRFSGDWLHAIAAYNCGEKNVERAIEQNRKAGKPTDFWSLTLPKETSSYVPRLIAVSTIVANPAAHGIALNPIPNEPYVAKIDVARPIDLEHAAALAGISKDEMKALNPAFKRGVTSSERHVLLVPADKASVFQQTLASLPTADTRIALEDGEPELLPRRHKVRKGETLGAIAKRYKVSVASLQRVNRLTGHQIREGKQLILPSKAAQPETKLASRDAGRKAQAETKLASREAAPKSAAAKEPAAADSTDGRVVHTVQNGDTLWRVSKRYQVSIDNLSAWNDISPNDTLSLGQKIVIWPAAAGYGQPKLVRTAAQVSKPRQQKVEYEVRKGDSLWTIARRFDVSVSELTEWNELPRNVTLQPGQTITILIDPDAVRI